jgi:plastocyanin
VKRFRVGTVVSIVLVLLLMPLVQANAATTTITIETDGVTPEKASVHLGEAVKWANEDTKSHRIVSQPRGFFHTARIAPSETSERVRIISAGSFPYGASADPSIAGIIRVPVHLRPGADTTPTPGATITIRVATGRRSHVVYDVQRKRDDGGWVTIVRNTPNIKIDFEPWCTGTFWFRARVTDTAADATSRWSPPREKFVAPPP